MATGYVLAAVGIVATISLGLLAYLQARRAFPRPDLRASVEFLPESPAGISFLLTLRNRGRYPAFVEDISLHLRSGVIVPFKSAHGLPLEAPLQVVDGIPTLLHFPISDLMKEMGTPHAVKKIVIRDSAGRNYELPAGSRWSRRAFNRDIQTKWSEAHQQYWEDRSGVP